nr:ABC transporter permease [Candidatus Acidoferrales bacterium]
MQSIWQDIRHGFRVLGKRPGITLIAILTLGLGIGANTAIFSVVDAVLLRPLPYKQPDRLVFLSESTPQIPNMSISMANLDDWRAMNTVFENIAPYRANLAVLTGEGQAESLRMREITASLFPTLGVQPILGRALTADDDKVGAAPVVLLSDGYWDRKFARDPNVLGKKLNLDGEIYTIVGVLPNTKFHGSWRDYSLFTSLWRHEDAYGGAAQRDEHPGIYAIARMKPGVTLEQARAQMKDIGAQLAKQYPKTNSTHSVTTDPLLNAIVGDVKPALLVLLVAVGFVLVIACANVANLMLARATERQREMAIRVALGATRGRLIRQLLTESMLLSVFGGALGLAIAFYVAAALSAAAPANVPRIDGASVDGVVLAFTFIVSLLTGLFFGIFPAWQVSRTDVHESIKEGGRSATSSAGHKRVRAALVVGEIAVSMILLVGAGLMLKSFYRVLHTDPGFNQYGVLTATISLPDSHYKDPATQRQFVDQLVKKFQTTPGVQAVGFQKPLLGGWETSYLVDGHIDLDPSQIPSTDITSVTPDSMRAMGVHLILGRFFTEADNEKAPPVCIVDTTMAQLAWPGQDPIGKRIFAASGSPNDPAHARTVVGLVAHTKNYGVDQPSREETYIPYAQRPLQGGSLVIRSAADLGGLASTVRAAVQSLDADLPVRDVRTLDEIVGDNVAPRQLSVILLSSFAGLALVLAAIGIYGVMSYAVMQRTQEIGVRIALGAQQRDILRLVMGNGMTLLLLGLTIGLAGAFSLNRFLQSMLFQVKSTDIMTFASVPFLLAAVAFTACYLPARRATLVDPVVALRND